MKRIKFSFFTLLAIILFATALCGQEKKNSFRISGIAAHYIGIEDDELIGSYWGYYSFPVDRGFEFSYFRHLSKSIEIGTGFNYQSGRVASYRSSLKRFHFYEINIPFVLKKDFIFNEKSSCFLTSGIYLGKTYLQKAENPDSAGNWHEFPSLDYLVNYSDDISFLDIYLDAGYSFSLSKLGEISLAPFAKYRANTTWLNYHQNKYHFGIKLNYSLKF
ncbi:MAG: hypothetical protein FD181_69 [Prolixibacteraceae bacterium]|nr:MAG: hypothetical protein FD181_69 [Prolixibacteraceae bacterium]